MNGLQCRPFFFCPAKQFSENWPKSVFEIVVRVERKKIPAANVPNGVIIINSLHIEEVPLPPYMDRPADTRAGCKHRCTDAAMEHFRAEVMELCHRENLYQIDLLHGSASIGRRKRGKPSWTRKPMPLPPRDYLPSLLSLKPARRSCARPSEKSLTRQAALTNFLPCCCNRA